MPGVAHLMAALGPPLQGLDMRATDTRSPQQGPQLSAHSGTPTRASLTLDGAILEAWGEGNNVGSLVILILIVFCNYRSGIWLHKLILLELLLAIWHGTFIFLKDPTYGWYLSSTATLLFISYQLHNVVSWLKIRSFLPVWGSRLFIISLICVQPYWIVEAWSNFAYFNSLGSNANVHTRPWEALFRDPWWIFTTWKLLDTIKKSYGFKIRQLVQINRRFGVMLLCMFLSIIFLLTDVIVTAAKLSADSGINPFWRLALVFKCASDTIILDDFKSVLDDIRDRRFNSQSNGARGRNAKSRNGKKASVSVQPEFFEFNEFGNSPRVGHGARPFPSLSASTRGIFFPSSSDDAASHKDPSAPDRVLSREKDEGERRLIIIV